MNLFGRMITSALVLALTDYITPPRTGTAFVRIATGDVEGYTLTSRNGREYKAFTGIPYGQPPVGNLRFSDPLPAEPWDDVRSAKENIRCVGYQFLAPDILPLRFAEGQEDCLSLSVYTHSTDPAASRPVLVYIHGGAFELRNPPIITWKPSYFMDYDIVVVIINYRLTVFGFLSFEDDEIPGNMGLKDQNLALRWIKNNIASFGGDPARVTLMGESAGGVSTNYHAIMPASRGLLSKAIMLSGSAYAPWALDPPGEARKRAFRMAAFAGCSNQNTSEIVSCLRAIPAYDLAVLMENFHSYWDRDPLVTFKPVVEKPSPTAFITKLPKYWDPVTVPVIAGVDNEDGLLRSIYMLQPKYDFNFVTRRLPEFLPESLIYNNSYTRDIARLTSKIIRHYFGPDRPFSIKDEPVFSKLFSDAWFRYPLSRTVQNTANDVYLYLNAFVYGKIAFVPGRTFHTQELLHLFEIDSTINLSLPNDANLDFSKELVKLYANFVIYGNPNGLEGNKWKKSAKSVEAWDFLVFTNTTTSMVSGLYADEVRFWRTNGFNEFLYN